MIEQILTATAIMYSEHSSAIAAPPQRRRRPVFACTQCRKRKIKCEQNSPCTQCQRSKDVVCTYASDSSPSQGLKTQRAAKNSSLTVKQRERYGLEKEFPILTPESSISGASAAQSPDSRCFPSTTERFFPESRPEYTPFSANQAPPAFKDRVSKSHLDLPSSLFSPDIERHVAENEAMPDLERRLRPSPIKMKLYGESHWGHQFMQFDKICRVVIAIERSDPSDPADEMSKLKLLLQKCKVLGRTIKPHNSLDWRSIPDFGSSLPPKEICDELIDNYFRTFECVHRILHIPSFMKEYDDFWSKQESEMSYSTSSIKILLVLAIGTAFWQGVERDSIRASARQWVFSAQQWLSAPLDKSRMNLSGIQIQCLLILARETVGLGSDLIWISAGTLLRSAMQLGFSRDPKHFPGISALHAELRRRLWATVLEMVMQACFHTAMPPMISMDDFDTEPPANINDIDLGRETIFPIKSQLLTKFTETTIQILLRRSLPTRIEIARSTTTLPPQVSYDEVLRLGSEITNSCLEVASHTSISHEAFSSFRRTHLDLLLRHSLVPLHRPWALKARTDPRYYYSRKVLLETSLTELPLLPSADYNCISMVGYGIWRELAALQAVNLAMEVIMQIEEEELNPPSEIQRLRSKAAREPLIQVLRDSVEVKRERLRNGEELNVRCAQFLVMFLAQAEAMENGENVEIAITEACRRSLEESFEILKAKAPAVSKEIGREQAPGWGGNMDGQVVDIHNYDFAQNLNFVFDMSDAPLFGDWEDPS